MERMIITFLMAVCALVFTAPNAGATGSVANGKRLYMTNCFQCHGPEGKGDGPAAMYLPRQPRDFTYGQFKLKTSPPSTILTRDEDIFGAISRGLSASGMPPWKNILSESEIRDIVAYVKSLSDLFDGEQDPERLDTSGKIPYSTASVEKGKKAYVAFHCNECHGPEGKGPSMKILKDDYGHRIWPRDLTRPWTFLGPYTPEDIYARITNGIPVTPMPGHTGMAGQTGAMKWDVVNYVIHLGKEERKRRNRMYTVAGMIALGGAICGSVVIKSRKKRR